MDIQNMNEDTKNLISNIIHGYMESDRTQKITRFNSLNKLTLKNQILFTGSSLMEQFPVTELCMVEGIDKIIYNRGLGGFTTDDFLANISTLLLDLKPSKVFINIGTNDINENNVENGDWLSHLIYNYDRILKQLKEILPSCEVFLMAYYPSNNEVIKNLSFAINPFTTRTNENIDRANIEVEILAKKYDYNFINVNQGLADSLGNLKEEYTSDGVHMYPEAYLVVLRNLRQYL